MVGSPGFALMSLIRNWQLFWHCPNSGYQSIRFLHSLSLSLSFLFFLTECWMRRRACLRTLSNWDSWDGFIVFRCTNMGWKPFLTWVSLRNHHTNFSKLCQTFVHICLLWNALCGAAEILLSVYLYHSVFCIFLCKSCYVCVNGVLCMCVWKCVCKSYSQTSDSVLLPSEIKDTA